MALLTKSLESATRKKIDLILTNLGWNTDESSRTCNVFTERAKTQAQNKKLKGKPDYVLYKSGTDEAVAVIETKRKGQSIDDALKQAQEKYANPLKIPIVFATDGALFKSLFLDDSKELRVDGQTVTELLTEKKTLRFIEEGSEISEATVEVKHTREELIRIFKWTNDLLRKEGLREGIERFSEFANILFLKLISELEEYRKKTGEERLLADRYCWKSFADLDAARMLEYINGTILPHLVKEYNHSGDVFQEKLGIKNAETLKRIVDKLSDLTLINADSDVKGDAFEYFLKNSVTIGNDLGEYFTPRHIVRLMVSLTNPQFGEKIYDPTCGTEGFIIEAFRHIKKSCKPTPANIKILREETIYGREITNTAKISKMNMILAGDGHTNIKQMDSLEIPIKELFDVVLANIPYGQNTDYGDLYPIKSNNADCVFVEHILQSLNGTGRAAIIVPEGFLFRGGSDAKVREWMVKNYEVQAVISLPSGVFLPYTSAKTDIIFIQAGRRTEKVWFYDMSADGFELSMVRTPIEQNDIGDIIGKWDSRGEIESAKCWNVSAEEISSNEYNLSITKYKKTIQYKSKHSLVPFKELMKENKSNVIIEDEKEYTRVTAKLHGQGIEVRDVVKGKQLLTKQQKVIHGNQFIVAEIDAKLGGFGLAYPSCENAIVSSHYFVFDLDTNKVLPDYFDYIVRYGPYEQLIQPYVKGTTNYASIRPQDVLELKLPLPSKEVQEAIVRKMSQLRAVWENIEKTVNVLKQSLVTEADFDVLKGSMVELGAVAEIRSGGTPSRSVSRFFKGEIPWVKIGDFKELDYLTDTEEKITSEAVKNSTAKILPKNTVLVSIFATIGAVSILGKEAATNQAIAGIIPDEKKILHKYLAYAVKALEPELKSQSRGIAQKNVNMTILKSCKIKVPSIQEQEELIKKIDSRRQVVSNLQKMGTEAKERGKLLVNSLFQQIF